jgi:hypothetical protein
VLMAPLSEAGSGARAGRGRLWSRGDRVGPGRGVLTAPNARLRTRSP